MSNYGSMTFLGCCAFLIFTVRFADFQMTSLTGSLPYNRPGTCPTTYIFTSSARSCTYDGECPNNQKCCPIGTTAYFYCATAQITTTNPANKPGTCPAIQPNNPGACILQCNNDVSCAGNLKCCGNGCGMVCTRPGTGSTTSKPGTCPTDTQMMSGTCSWSCTTDASCFGTQKCCYNGCGTTCTNPTVSLTGGGNSKPGRCGNQGSYQGGCTTQCYWDDNCVGSQKCCRNACGARVCSMAYPNPIEDPYLSP